MTALVSIKIDETQIAKLASLMAQAGPQTSRAIMRAVNWTGDRAYTQVMRQLGKQTGALRKVLVKRVVKKPAFPGQHIVYRIVARAPAMPLSDFAPHQTRKGITAAPWRKRRVFPHAFTNARLHGRIFVRTGSKRLPLRQLWGPVIANDLVRGETQTTFYATVNARLLGRLDHELGAILTGVAPRA